jgi:Predicted sugar phosphate isomerase
MVKLGKTFGNLMVDVQASNEKLRARAERAVASATAAPDKEVAEAIAAADGDTKVASCRCLRVSMPRPRGPG